MGRRELLTRLEEARRRERQASYLAHVRGSGLSSEGHIFVPWSVIICDIFVFNLVLPSNCYLFTIFIKFCLTNPFLDIFSS